MHGTQHATWGNSYWTVFLAVVLASFLAPEIYALATNSANTLSDWVWRLLKVTEHQPMSAWDALHFLAFGSWLVVVAWLTDHFFFGGLH